MGRNTGHVKYSCFYIFVITAALPYFCGQIEASVPPLAAAGQPQLETTLILTRYGRLFAIWKPSYISEPSNNDDGISDIQRERQIEGILRCGEDELAFEMDRVGTSRKWRQHQKHSIRD